MFAILDTNPYEPTHVPHTNTLDVYEPFAVRPRLDWFVCSTFVVSALSAIAIYLYHSTGTAMIGDPILARLAEHSVVWIPIYRLSPVILIFFMPNGVRQSFAVFFLVVGILSCVNDFGGHFFARYLVQEAITIPTAFILCFSLSCLYSVTLFLSSSNRRRLTRNTLGWLAVVLAVEGVFFAIGRTMI